MKLFKRKGINKRGAAIRQVKNWQPLQLPRKTRFIHCGSAPFAQETEGLLLKYALEECEVTGTPDKKFILGFPFLSHPPGIPVPDQVVLAKPCQLLWSMDEMPRGFIFEIPAGRTVWTKNAILSPNEEVGFNFDIIFEDFLLAQYQRTSLAKMGLKPLTGVSWV